MSSFKRATPASGSRATGAAGATGRVAAGGSTSALPPPVPSAGQPELPAFIPGTRKWLDGSLLLSSGHVQLDGLLGGGYQAGSLIVLEEDTAGVHGYTLAQLFAAEGVACGHRVVVAGHDGRHSAPDFLSSLPLNVSRESRDLVLLGQAGTPGAGPAPTAQQAGQPTGLSATAGQVRAGQAAVPVAAGVASAGHVHGPGCSHGHGHVGAASTGPAASHVHATEVSGRDDHHQDHSHGGPSDPNGALLKNAWQYKKYISASNAGAYDLHGQKVGQAAGVPGAGAGADGKAGATVAASESSATAAPATDARLHAAGSASAGTPTVPTTGGSTVVLAPPTSAGPLSQQQPPVPVSAKYCHTFDLGRRIPEASLASGNTVILPSIPAPPVVSGVPAHWSSGAGGAGEGSGRGKGGILKKGGATSTSSGTASGTAGSASASGSGSGHGQDKPTSLLQTVLEMQEGQGGTGTGVAAAGTGDGFGAATSAHATANSAADLIRSQMEGLRPRALRIGVARALAMVQEACSSGAGGSAVNTVKPGISTPASTSLGPSGGLVSPAQPVVRRASLTGPGQPSASLGAAAPAPSVGKGTAALHSSDVYSTLLDRLCAQLLPGSGGSSRSPSPAAGAAGTATGGATATTAASSATMPTRVVLLGLGGPQWPGFTGCDAAPGYHGHGHGHGVAGGGYGAGPSTAVGTEAVHAAHRPLLLALARLKRLLEECSGPGKPGVVAVVTVPTWALPLVVAEHVRSHADIVLKLHSFGEPAYALATAGAPRVSAAASTGTAAEFSSYTGLLLVRRMTRVGAPLGHLPDTLTWIFKRDKRKMVIEQPHLPPEGEGSGSGGAAAGGAASVAVVPAGGGGGLLHASTTAGAQATARAPASYPSVVAAAAAATGASTSVQAGYSGRSASAALLASPYVGPEDSWAILPDSGSARADGAGAHGAHGTGDNGDGGMVAVHGTRGAAALPSRPGQVGVVAARTAGAALAGPVLAGGVATAATAAVPVTTFDYDEESTELMVEAVGYSHGDRAVAGSADGLLGPGPGMPHTGTAAPLPAQVAAVGRLVTAAPPLPPGAAARGTVTKTVLPVGSVGGLGGWGGGGGSGMGCAATGGKGNLLDF